MGPEDPVAEVLRTLGNPIRKAAVRALGDGGMRFSQLMAACGLSYDHDAGHFCYHLSELINRRIVEKTGQDYHLTELGSKLGEMLDYIERECSFLLASENEIGEDEMEQPSHQTEWIERGREESFEKRINKGRIRVGFHTEPAALRRRVAKELPEGSERSKLLKFLDETESWKGPITLLVKEKDLPIAWAVVNSHISWGDRPDEETGKPKVFAKTSLRAENIIIEPWKNVNRKAAALTLLRELLEKARQVGADAIHLAGVAADDSSTIEASRELGFERISTSYTLRASPR